MNRSANTNAEGICQTLFINTEEVQRVSAQMPAPAATQAMAETFKLLGDPTRLRLVHALSYGELCVCDLASMLGVGQTTISNHLRLLRSMRLVTYRKAGKIAYYSLADDHITRLIAECARHVQEFTPSATPR
ncbi:helix-turn-helix transcriptional regulator [bacterium]|nr:helix-turn-helix transcriptional regulator [bacterium]